MKIPFSRLLAISLCAFTLGIAGTAHADRETIIGGALGAAAGALIGEQVYGRDGMMMGGIVGGALGAVAGKSYEDNRADRKRDKQFDDWRQERARERDWRHRNNGYYNTSPRYNRYSSPNANPRYVRGEPPRRTFSCPPGLARQGRC